MMGTKGQRRISLEGQKVLVYKVEGHQSAGNHCHSCQQQKASLEPEKNKIGAVRESKRENVPGSVNV